MRGLLDACPRCGYEPSPGVKLEELEAHLSQCNDVKAQAEHKKNVAAMEAKKAKKAEVKDAESEAQNLMAWQYLGGSTESMWLLTDTQLTKQCEERGLTHGDAVSREEMLASLAMQQKERDGVKRLTDGSGGGGGGGSGSGGGDGGGGPSNKRAKVSMDSLPNNLHTMSLGQLKAVCASHGMIAKGTTCAEVIGELEAACYEGTEAAPAMLLEDNRAKPKALKQKEGPKPAGGAAKKRKPVKKESSSEEDEPPSDSDSSDDDVPIVQKMKKMAK